MLSLFSFSLSRIMLRYSPYSVPNSVFRLCFPSTSSLHSNSQSQSLDKYIDIFTRLLSMRPPPSINSFNMILGVLAKMNDFPTALPHVQLLEARGFQFNEVTYVTLIQGLCKTRHTSAAIQVLRKIPMNGIVPNVVMYSTIIDSLCKAGLVNLAFRLFSEMLAKGISPDVQSYNIMINGFCKSKMLDQALNLSEEMLHNYLVPNTVTYSILIDSLCKSKRISCALELFGKMHDRGQTANIVTYNSLLNGLFKNKQLDKALMLFNQMKKSGIDLNINTYRVLIDGLYNAKEIFQDFCVIGCPPNVRAYNIKIDGLCKKGLFKEALTQLSEMEHNGCLPNAVTFVTVIHALFEKDENDMAEKLLREMIARGLLNLDKKGAGDGFPLVLRPR
ncbi:Pentatricopeptide repeat-containing protein [Arachis hypogaea]|nr:Pentatricopeptide repeat-containing protein [Arachis hypogaea]